MQHDMVLFEKLVRAFVCAYMEASGEYFADTYDRAERVSVIQQVTGAAFTYAYSLVRKYQWGASADEVVAEAARKGREYVPTLGG